MAQLSARRAALAAMRAWRTEKRFAHSIIFTLLAKTKLSASDRAFALELFYGVLRNSRLLDFWIGRLRTAPVDVNLRDVLRLGLYQLFILETSEHAAVYETVELAQKKHRALINGILRAALRRKGELAAQGNAQPLDVRTSHPRFLVARWEQNFGTEAAEALCTWNNQPPSLYARINRLKIDREKFLRTYPESRPLLDNPDFVELDVFPSEALARGHCYIQDPSTTMACQLLDPQPGEKVLDVCAAPGGKTGYIAELMRNRGMIVACDRASERVRVLEENMAQLGVDIAHVVAHDWGRSRVPKEIVSIAPFHRILIDAPCSNTGVMRRRVDVRWRLEPADFVRMQKQELEIVRAVFGLLGPSGVLVYSTCSLEPEENEELVRRVLADLSMFRLERTKHSIPFRDYFDGSFAAKLVKSTS
ncbi:MAG TPA: 16S rRNA (cytosine(967)-C(5))-methyltransferase RsmB [Chthoniobacterales bacterium]|nr:16S rRNA (cytosine(967)-C(5))-methyltransferase RsmB [Chthoniobacterales bacterium]